MGTFLVRLSSGYFTALATCSNEEQVDRDLGPFVIVGLAQTGILQYNPETILLKHTSLVGYASRYKLKTIQHPETGERRPSKDFECTSSPQEHLSKNKLYYDEG